MSLSQMGFINSSVPVKAMNNDIYLYLWKNESVCNIFEVSALRHNFFFLWLYLQMLTIENTSFGIIC